MKFLKGFFIVLGILIIISAIGVFVFLKTFDINKYRSRIIDQVSQALHRPVDISSLALDISFKQGLRFTMEDLVVKDSPQFSSEPLVRVGSADLHINPVILLMSQKIFISEIGLNNVSISLVRDQQGTINLQKVISDIDPSPAGASPASPAKNPPASHPQNALPNLLVNTITVNNGAVSFIDKTTDPALRVRVDKIDLSVSNLSLDKPFSYELAFSLLSDKQNVKIAGLAQLDLEDNQVQVRNLQVRTDLQDISLKKVTEYFPSFKDSGLESMGGELTFGAKQMKVGPSGLLGLLSTTVLNNGKIKIKQLNRPFENIHFLINIGDRDMTIQDFSVGLNSGKIEILGQISDYLGNREGRLSIAIDGISAEGLLPEGQLPCEVQGKFFGKLDAKGQWGVPRSAVLSSLATGNFELKDGKLLDYNILKAALEKIAVIPNLVETVEANLPERWKEVLAKEETVLEKVAFEIKIEKGTLFINKADMGAEGLNVTATGDLDFNQNLSLKADLYIDPELSKGIIVSVPQLSSLQDEEGRINIPFKPYRGKLASAQMIPDIADLGRTIIMDQGKEQLKNAIFKALDIEPVPPQDANAPAPQPNPADGAATQTPSPETQQRPEEVIINEILDKVFK